MHELGIESSQLQAILDGDKTIELCLGMPQFLKLRVGMVVSLREETWQDGRVAKFKPHAALATITQLLYFETLAEALNSVNYTGVIPTSEDPDEVLAVYAQRYTEDDEAEYGIIAVTFRLAE